MRGVGVFSSAGPLLEKSMSVRLYKYQKEAVSKMKNGCILCGGVGSGKSMTSLAYYFIKNGGKIGTNYKPMKNPKDLYIITTAKKRDSKDWEEEMSRFLIDSNDEFVYYDNKVCIDSWNNIKKYVDITDAFFIFDEQRVVGYGTWTKSFLKITKNNEWVLLSATPGDCWSDYIPVFIANGFYKNKTDFAIQHIVYNSYAKFQKIERYVGTKKLERLRNEILVNMDYKRPAELIHLNVNVGYDIISYKRLLKNRWNLEKNQPILNASELCYGLRKIVNSDPSRLEAIEEICLLKSKVIIFYSYDYELEILREYFKAKGTPIGEWNGHRHEEIPNTNSWAYLVQYTAGCEGWNCVETDTIIFYSQSYSYKATVQASGRIDRLNTPFKKLYFYHLKSKSGIDVAIARALANKKRFNEKKFVSFN